MRLIDADILKGDISKLPIMSNWGEAFMPELVDEQPTIDPETLPIVRELREQLAKVTAERDAAMRGELIESIKLCLEKSPDKNTVYVPRTLIEKIAFVMQEDGKDG